MKKLIYLIMLIGALALIVTGCGLLTVPPAEESEIDSKGKPPDCTTIQDGVLTYSAGHYLFGTPLVVGFDPYGNNYQAHIFNGSYANNYLGRDCFPPYEGDDGAYLAENPGVASTWYWPYRDVQIVMKWNDAWLSNKDCGDDTAANSGGPDGKLDRHFGYDSYIGSGAWLTNHQSGCYSNIVDEFDIGDTDSEDGHNLEGWSDIWTWGGGYGGGDDKTLRLLMGPGDGCGDGYQEAYFTMDTYGAEAHKLILRHLDGIAEDDFDVYIWQGNKWKLIGSYDALGVVETWETTEYTFSPRSGELKFKLVATGENWDLCEKWGQVAFSWVQLEGTCCWNYFVKIVAAPADAYADADVGVWYTADGIEIGPVIWGAFAIVQQVENDACAGLHGLQYLSPAGPGFGQYLP